jgi:hypothetical protein
MCALILAHPPSLWWLIAGSAFSTHRYIVGYLFGMLVRRTCVYLSYVVAVLFAGPTDVQMWVSSGQYSS